MANKKYKVLEPLNHNNIHYVPGTEVELTEVEADSLRQVGVIEGGQTVEVATFEADGGKHLSPDEGIELATPVPTPADNSREEELKALFKAKGWRELAKIAEPLGIEKPEAGWDEAIPQIVAKEKELETP